MDFTTNTLDVVASPKKIVSSAYCKKSTITLFFSASNAQKKFPMMSLIKPIRPLATTVKRKGESGSPCPNLLCGINYIVGLPFTKMEMKLDVMQPLIHEIHLVQNLNLSSIYHTNFHLIESQAFSQFTLKIIHFFFFLFASSTTSFATNTLCNKYLHSMNALCLTSITPYKTSLHMSSQNLFSIILYIQPKKKIDGNNFFIYSYTKVIFLLFYHKDQRMVHKE